jgi:hypothetical protein
MQPPNKRFLPFFSKAGLNLGESVAIPAAERSWSVIAQ